MSKWDAIVWLIVGTVVLVVMGFCIYGMAIEDPCHADPYGVQCVSWHCEHDPGGCP